MFTDVSCSHIVIGTMLAIILQNCGFFQTYARGELSVLRLALSKIKADRVYFIRKGWSKSMIRVQLMYSENTLSQHTRLSKLRWFGRVLRMTNIRLPCRALFYLLSF